MSQSVRHGRCNANNCRVSAPTEDGGLAIGEFAWRGPRQLVKVKGTVDAVDIVEPEAGRGKSNRFQIALVDAALEYGNGDTESVETWQRSIPTEGRPGQALYASACKVLGMKKGDALTPEQFLGGVITLAVAQEGFTTGTGDKAQMGVYTILDFQPAGAIQIDEGDVLAAIEGKTVKEVFDIRGNYRGTNYAQILGNSKAVLKYFKGKVTLENGVYKVTG